MKSQIAQKALVALIIVVFVFVVGNLIYNVENLYIGEEIEPTFYQPTQISGSPIASMSTLADAIRYIWFAMLGIMILAIAVSVYYFVKSKEKKKWRNLLVKIVVGLIVAVVVLGFLLTYNGFDVQNSSDGSSILPGGGGSGQGGTDGQNQTSGAPTGMQVLVSFGLVFLAFGVIVLAGVGIFTFLNMRSVKLAYDKGDLHTKEIAQTVQTAIETLHKGSDAKSTIIRCYNDMCKAMAKHGLTDEDHLTPREFEAMAEKSLPISKVHLHALVSVFEEARYSAHSLSSKEGQRATLCLEKVLADLVKSKKNAKGECLSGT